MECTVDGCEQAPSVRGLCLLHYQRERRLGTTELSTPSAQRARSISTADRLRGLGYDVEEIASTQGYHRVTDVARHYSLSLYEVGQVWRQVDPGDRAIPNIVARPRARDLIRDVEILVIIRGLNGVEAARTLGLSPQSVWNALAQLGYTSEQASYAPHAASLNQINQVGHK